MQNSSKIDIKVAIVEDADEVRQDVVNYFNDLPGFIAVGAYLDCESAIENIPKNPPDVLLMDIKLPGMSGVEGVRAIKEILPEVEIIMLTMYEDNTYVFDSLRNGASGYLLKNASPTEIKNAVLEVMEGGAPMSMRIARMVTDSFRRQAPEKSLTQRESEVLEKICLGKNYQTIANELFISKTTVKFHIRNIYRKLHVTNKAQAMLKAFRKRFPPKA